MSSLQEAAQANLRAVNERITQAARAAGRPPQGIALVAVSKTFPAEAVIAVAAGGQVDFGENYVQEAVAKIEALGDAGLTWHFIGQLQGNKTREVAACFDWVHTLDRERIAARLSAQRPHHAEPLQVLLQVRLADEPGKGGVSPAEAPALAAAVSAMPRLQLRGLMCIPPPATDLEAQRRPFRQLRELMQSLNEAGHALDTLSMGMSDDLEAAVLEGATIVRVGTAIFGRRPG